MKIYRDIDQKSDEWFALRQLKMTASHASTIISNGKGLDTYCKDLVCDYINTPTERYTNPDIERGNLLENQARTFCTLITGTKWEEVGFVEDSKYVGVSPDGVVFDGDKIVKSIEIKCPSNRVFLELILTDEIDPKYYAQMQMQMLVMKTKECVYFAYNTDIKPYYFMKIITPDEKIQDKLKAGLKNGKTLIEGYLNEYKSKVAEF